MVKPDVLEAGFNQPESHFGAVEWRESRDPVAYGDAIAWMDTRVAAIRAGEAHECVWLLEHPPIYTGGTSADPSDLLEPDRFPVFRSGRGGQFTYHGPGQRVVYVMLDLDKRGRDVRAYVCALEDWIIATLATFGIAGERRPGRVGVWVSRPELGVEREDKIAAVGVRIRRWVTFHGISINVSPDLSHFSGIVPCGVQDHGVTSHADLGITATLEDVDRALRETFPAHFSA